MNEKKETPNNSSMPETNETANIRKITNGIMPIAKQQPTNFTIVVHCTQSNMISSKFITKSLRFFITHKCPCVCECLFRRMCRVKQLKRQLQETNRMQSKRNNHNNIRLLFVCVIAVECECAIAHRALTCTHTASDCH